MDDVYENNEDHNPNKERKILIVFADMIAHIIRVIKNLIQQ